MWSIPFPQKLPPAKRDIEKTRFEIRSSTEKDLHAPNPEPYLGNKT